MHFGLVVQLQFVAVERSAQVVLQLQLHAGVLLHGGREECKGGATGALGGVQGLVGALGQGITVDPDQPIGEATTAGEGQVQRLGRIDSETLLVTLSAGRSHPLLARAMKLAEHREAKTLAIADATLSEAVDAADMSLYYSSNSPSFLRSNTALMALVHALAHGVYSRDEEAHKDRIRAYKLK